MKLATPLTVDRNDETALRDATGSIIADTTGVHADTYAIEIVAAVNDHARLTADLADAVAALKNYARDCTCASCCTTRALVARVEART